MRLQRYCSCGAVLDVVIDRKKKDQALSVWFAAHSTHAPATRAHAEAARMGTGQPMGREARKDKSNG